MALETTSPLDLSRSLATRPANVKTDSTLSSFRERNNLLEEVRTTARGFIDNDRLLRPLAGRTTMHLHFQILQRR